MKVLDSLDQMREHLPEGSCAPMVAVLEMMADYIDGPLGLASFTELFGAPAFLIEQVEELALVRSVEERDGRRLSLADCASGWFDIAEWIDDGSFARFVAIDGADGGAQFYVPRVITDQVSSVEKSIQLTAARAS